MSGQGNLLIMALDEEWEELPAGLLGQKIIHPNGKIYQVVQSNEGATIAKNMSLKWNDRDTYKVERIDAITDKVCGVTPDERGSATVTDQYYFYMQVAGDAVLTNGDHGVSIPQFGLIGPDDDTDEGKVGLALQKDMRGVEELKEEDGDSLGAATNPTLTQLANEEFVVTWAAADVAMAKSTIQVPDDFDAEADVLYLSAFVLQQASNDAINLDAEVYRIRDGVANSADLNPTAAAITQGGTASTPEKVQLDLSGNSILPGDILDIQVAPTAHANDPVECFGWGLEYQSINKPENAFAKALEATAVTDAEFNVRLLDEKLAKA